MKGLSIVKQMVTDGQISQEVAEKYFPELKESEDERIRTFLHHTFTAQYLCKDKLGKWHGEPVVNILAYLEKQGKTFTNKDVDDAYLKGICDAKHELEKQSEQKPADKVEPKFKVGYFVVIQETTYQITKVENLNVALSLNGRECIFDIEVLKNAHLWTIQDAKDGDVIYEKVTETVILFKSEDCGWIDSHCSYWQKTKTFERGERQYGRVSEMNICPATKEQRDLLFQKMREAEYEWDAEKKELKKIEQKPAWSEEDENVITAIIAALSLFAKEKDAEDCFDMETTWLKSLKDRYFWKPSKEQMDAMQVFLEHGCAAPDREASLAEKFLESLYNDLKNL